MGSFFTDKIQNQEGSEIIARISFEDIKIEIFGEVHNTPLPTNHVYKELIDHKEFQDALVLVEHSSLLCELYEGDDKIFKDVIKKSGSEFIFYKALKKKLDNVFCIDNRLEFDLFNRMDEVDFETLIHTLIEANEINRETKGYFNLLLNELLPKVKTFLKNKEYYIKYDEFKDTYKECIDSLMRQMEIVQEISKMKIKDLKKKDILVEADMTNYQLGMTAILNMFLNIKMLSNLTVDINILNFINEKKDSGIKNILIFTGLNHALRLSSSKMLNDESNDLISSGKYEQNANITPISDLEQETHILSYFK
jgi:hypothetical protein